MKFSIIHNVEKKIFLFLFFFYYFLLYNEINCSRKPKLKNSNFFNIYSVVSKDLKLKNKNEYTKTINEGIKIYEEVNKKTKVYFLPLILKNNNKRIERTFIEKNEEKNQSENIKFDKGNNENSNTTINESSFEYLENNLTYLKDKMKIFCQYINECDFILIPISYNDVLNKHLFDISSFNNLINALDYIFYLEQEKNDFNLIFIIYNYGDSEYDDKFIKKEKTEIMNIIKMFLKCHWEEKYDKYIKINFRFENDNTLDIQKISTEINKKHYKRRKRNEKIHSSKEENVFFENYKPDTLKNLYNENYFLYNFFSNFKLNILQEYLKITKDVRINNLDIDLKKINIKRIIKDVENILNQFTSFQLNENSEYHKNSEKIKNRQYSYLVHIILTDLLEKYDYNLEKIKNDLYQLFKENIRKIKITSNIMHELKREINYVDKLFEFYNSKISFLDYFKKKNKDFEQKAYYIYYYNKVKFLQLLNETTNEIINYYISKGLYVRNYDFNSLMLLKKYSFFNYIIYYITNLLKNKVNFTFNYLSPNAFGFSSYKDDISLSPKKDIMVTTSEIDQLEKISIPHSEYSKILMLLDKNKR
ncbi:conserved Plasmodium protein, unknown function [Plasmodium gallinaceum]|uniref:Uncharacterized protein n=1 Tax=Plasmodium gallinaceum TaxID=5849 RepID=A0A1J1GXU8_PLAGA|nr:conserved Plasmodium protein, unknown function [Plasmodium gallinaceum]CRG96120.1 conserved Plasmodium protein, unknown function [Plasmodium gallinaceum]